VTEEVGSCNELEFAALESFECSLRREYERKYVTVIEESGRSFETAAKAKLTGLPKPHQRSVDRSCTKLIGSVVQQ
jgi:hypothetical protein